MHFCLDANFASGEAVLEKKIQPDYKEIKNGDKKFLPQAAKEKNLAQISKLAVDVRISIALTHLIGITSTVVTRFF